jgi:hypothetical protein
MRVHGLLAWAAVCLVLHVGPARTPAGERAGNEHAKQDAKQDAKPRLHHLDIRVTRGDWANAPPDNIKKTCESAAMELWRYFPGRRLHPIRISRSHEGPIVLFERLPGGEYQVRLDSQGTYWAQFSFQFAHEFCHVLCNYRAGPQPNKWFEESVCETASLFVLRRMAETWKTSPPYPNWKDFAPHLKDYADKRIQEVHLPAGTTLAQWYRQHARQLGAGSCQRDLNRVVAAALLPLLESQPQHWEAVAYLNAGKSYPGQSFQEYLEDWEYYVPDKHKPFVRRIMRLFEVDQYGAKRPS